MGVFNGDYERLGAFNLKNHKSIRVNTKKLKKIYSDLPESFGAKDVKSALSKYQGITEPSKTSVWNYAKYMEMLGLVEVDKSCKPYTYTKV